VAILTSSFVRRNAHGVGVEIMADILEIFECMLAVTFMRLLCGKLAMSSSGVDTACWWLGGMVLHLVVKY
jgi:hypothetical protein